jgi:hypothetical protein
MIGFSGFAGLLPPQPVLLQIADIKVFLAIAFAGVSCGRHLGGFVFLHLNFLTACWRWIARTPLTADIQDVDGPGGRARER